MALSACKVMGPYLVLEKTRESVKKNTLKYNCNHYRKLSQKDGDEITHTSEHDQTAPLGAIK